MRSRGVDTRPFFFPLHRQPLLSDFGLADQEQLKVSERLGRQGIYLPSYLGITDDDIAYAAGQIVDVISESAR